MKKLLAPLAVIALLAIAIILPVSSTANSETPPANAAAQQRRPDNVVQRRAQEPAVRTNATIETFDKLITKAQSEGEVKVIIRLKLDSFQPEGALAGPSAVASQREEISRAQATVIQRLASFNAKEIRTFKFIPFAAMTVDRATLEQLKLSDDVVGVEEDIPVPPLLGQSVPLIGAPAAWQAGHSGSGQAVAILDTGVDKFHSFLAGKVVSEACFSTNGFGGTSVCPGGVSSSTSTGSGVNCASSINGCSHGTHVAGIAAGKGSTFNGVAKDANIIAIQVFSRFDSTTDCKGPAPCVLSFISNQISGLERVFALRNTFNIASANMSLGGGRFTSNCDTASQKAAIDNLRSVGIATVIASGNEGMKDALASPACISSAISVGATGDGSGSVFLDSVAGFSNSASFLSLLAPGNLILSSTPSATFSNFQGTSMAAPHVAGAWAVLKSKKPTATVTEVLNALRDTGLSVTDVNGITKPRIKVDAAVNAIGGGTGCATTPIAFGQTISGALTTTDCRFPVGSQWFSDAYSFNGTAGQQIAIAMSSSTFDTWIDLVGPSGSIIVSDNNGGGGTNSRIPANTGFFTLPSSGTYVIQATSFSTNVTGSYIVTLSRPPTGVLNDHFVNAQTISGSFGTVSGNNVGATREPGEPAHGATGGASVWYRWVAPASGLVRFTTIGSNYDTLLGIYTGSSVSGLSLIGANDDAGFSTLTSQVEFNAVAGVTYRIAVDGFFGSTGNIVLNWGGLPPPPANNNFLNAQTLSGSSGTVTGSNLNATKEFGEPNHAGNVGGLSVWYRWQAPSSGLATITTAGSNFDTLLGVYTGSAVSGLVTIASNDDQNFPITLSSRVQFNAVAGTIYRIAVDGYAGARGNITLNFSLATSTPTVQFSSSAFTVSETTLNATITVTRSGSTSGTSIVNFATSDIAGLQSCSLANGRASERCDYVTSIGTVRFNPGETSKTISVPIINDVLVEGSETFTVRLTSPSGASLGTSTATVTIGDNDLFISFTNPIDGVEFFIRQQYLDILNRQPDSGGLQNWINTLGPCPNGGFGEPPTSTCDRLHVASGFFQSDEFLNRGYWAFRFYMASLNQRPTYAQFIPDMAQVGGPKSPAEEQASKVAFADAFVQRSAFTARYGTLTGQPLANAILQTAGLPTTTFTVTSGMTRGQILRGIIETSAVSNKFLVDGTVSIQYFGFLRRDPDATGYQNNVNTLRASPSNLRHMIFIFIYSPEYRSRFGPP